MSAARSHNSRLVELRCRPTVFLLPPDDKTLLSTRLEVDKKDNDVEELTPYIGEVTF